MKIIAKNEDFYGYFEQFLLNGSPSVISRGKLYLEWLKETGGHWMFPNLAEYRDYLLTRISPISAEAHLSTIRGKYKKLLKDVAFNDYVLSSFDGNATERLIKADGVINRIKLLIDAENSRVPTIEKQDFDEGVFYWLTTDEANELLNAPNTNTLIGLRDYIAIATLLCTGVRVMELVNIKSEDCFATFYGTPAIRVRRGKGGKMRIVPLGEFSWLLDDIKLWLNEVRSDWLIIGIKNNKPQNKPITERAIQKILKKYPIMRGNKLITLKPHDLRRTYARTLYDMGMDIAAIRENMGHKTVETTKRYIGNIGTARIPTAKNN